MDIHIAFENGTTTSIKGVYKREVNSDSYHIWIKNDNELEERIFKTKDIKYVSIERNN